MIYVGGANPVLGLSEVFVFLFIALGPSNFIELYGGLTANADARLRTQIAVRAILVALVCLLLAAIVGVSTLEKWRISVAAIALAAGFILFFVAMRSIVALYSRQADAPASAQAPNLASAISPLGFPSIATPYGIATVIVLITLAPAAKLAIIGLTVVVLVIDLIFMLLSPFILRAVGMPLMLLSVVMAVLQVGASIQIVFFAIRTVLSKGF